MSEPVFDYDQLFDEDYLYFYGEMLEQSADVDAELACRLGRLSPGQTVLDLACGHGRITDRLALRGMEMTGLDATPLFLERARARGGRAEYVLGDMRSLPWPDGTFDGVVSWFTSFGYFSDEDNRRVLREAHRVLRPGGRLLIEGNNLAELLPRWLPATVVERDGDMAIDQARFDPVSGRAQTERVIVRGGRARRFRFSVRMFLAAELGGWLREAGFAAAEFFGADGRPLTARSRRMVAVAER